MGDYDPIEDWAANSRQVWKPESGPRNNPVPEHIEGGYKDGGVDTDGREYYWDDEAKRHVKR